MLHAVIRNRAPFPQQYPSLHLTLTDGACESYDTNAKMNPPLREPEDVAALVAALKEGVIDCIASDHAPHAYDEKEAAFDDAPFGIVGLETAFGVAHTALVQGGVLSLPELIARGVPLNIVQRRLGHESITTTVERMSGRAPSSATTTGTPNSSTCTVR